MPRRIRGQETPNTIQLKVGPSAWPGCFAPASGYGRAHRLNRRGLYPGELPGVFTPMRTDFAWQHGTGSLAPRRDLQAEDLCKRDTAIRALELGGRHGNAFSDNRDCPR